MNQVIITLPSIKAVSRNDTTGHYYNYRTRLIEAENWMAIFGKRFEHHFTDLVDVHIEAFYDVRGRNKICDSSNVDDKIFIDTLVRYKQQKKGKAIERNVWFVEDDSPTYIRKVSKEVYKSDHYAVKITITQVSTMQEGTGNNNIS